MRRPTFITSSRKPIVRKWIIQETNGISASVNLGITYLNEIRSDYNAMYRDYKDFKDAFTGEMIDYDIGDPAVI